MRRGGREKVREGKGMVRNDVSKRTREGGRDREAGDRMVHGNLEGGAREGSES